jgi:serine phosphatase RsbU (regulator of sigma subunit)
MMKKTFYSTILPVSIILSVIFFTYLYPRYFCAGSVSINFSKEKAIAHADSILTALGYTESRSNAAVTTFCNQITAERMRLILGSEKALELQKKEIPVFFWQVSWQQSKTASNKLRSNKNRMAGFRMPQQFSLMLDNNGKMRDFFVSGRMFRNFDGQQLQEEDDKNVEQVARNFILNFTAFTIPDSNKPIIKQGQQRGGTGRQVIWTAPVVYTSITQTISVDIFGDHVIGFSENLNLPDVLTSHKIEDPVWFMYFTYFIATLLLVLIFRQLYFQVSLGHADFKRAFWLGLWVTGSLIASEILHLIIQGTPIFFEPFRLLLAIIVGFSLAIIYMAAEPVARSFWQDKLESFDLLLSGIVFHKKISPSILWGLVYGLLIFALTSLILICAEIFSLPLSFHIHDFNKILDVRPPIIALLRGLFWRVPILVLVFFFFVPSFLAARKIERKWIVIISGLIFGASMFPIINFHPAGLQVIFAVIIGMMLTWLFISHDLISVIIAVNVIFLSLRIPPLLQSTVPEYFISGLAGLLILVIFLTVSIIGLFKTAKKVKSATYIPAYLKHINAQAKMKRELEIASEIQRSLQPKQLSPVKNFNVSALFIPSEEVGGDTYDFIRLSENQFAVAVTDVSGHGIAAALLASHIQAKIRIMLKYEQNPANILTELNQYLYQETPKYLFATMFLVIGDTSGKFTYSSAGHNPAFLLRNKNSIVELEKTGLALGLIGLNSYKKSSNQLNRNESLFIYTDGITEAINNEKEEFGEQRLISFLKERARKENFTEKLSEALADFTDGKNSDDVTGVFIQYIG